MRTTSSILHVDLDAFYASVEQRDDPSLRGVPIAVGGPAPRGVVTAASYEARRYGVCSAIPTAQAMQLCPQLIVIPMDMERYAQASSEFFAILNEFSPLVEGLSMDEAFLDVEGEERLLGDGPSIARQIKQRVRDTIDLVASVGVAPTKFVAKIASDLEKPDGLCVVRPGNVLDFLHPLPVSRLWGVGKVTFKKLTELGLNTIGDLARYPEQLLRKRVGPGAGAHLAALSRGEDPRRITPDRGAVSIGHEQTFRRDFERRDDLVPTLLGQADQVATRLRKANLSAKVVCIKIKYGNFKLLTRRVTLSDPTSDGSVIGKTALELLAKVEITGSQGNRRSVRLCGVSVSQLQDRDAAMQLTLDQPARQRGETLGDTLDEINDKFGRRSIGRAIDKRN